MCLTNAVVIIWNVIRRSVMYSSQNNARLDDAQMMIVSPTTDEYVCVVYLKLINIK